MLEAINIPEDYELLDLMDDVATSTTAKADSVDKVSTDKATEAKTDSKSTEESETKSGETKEAAKTDVTAKSEEKAEAKDSTTTKKDVKVDASPKKDDSKSASKSTTTSEAKPMKKDGDTVDGNDGLTFKKSAKDTETDENSVADVMPYWRANQAVLKDKMPGSASITIDAVEGNTTAPAKGLPKYGPPSPTWHARPTKWKGNYEAQSPAN